MSDIGDFAASIPGFYKKTAVEQLLVIAWFLEARQGKSGCDGAAIRQAFRSAGLEPPDTSVYLPRLLAKRPAPIVKVGGLYRLSAPTRRELDARLGGDPTSLLVTKALQELPAKIPDLAERAFLLETLNCYRVKAYRASITMIWNLTYDHITRWIFSDASRLSQFNAGLSAKYPKKAILIQKIEDFEELKESETLEVLRTSGLVSKNRTQILKEKLARRNMAAHPSRVEITQHQADDAITDLVINIILPLA